tara:strand:+ start:713 stop:2131 length:1419 start_codon:yes stop_codon:yes gene_type:complete
MVFSSALFLLYFLPVFLLFYYLTPGIWKNYTALGFSLMFYSWGAPIFIFFLLASCLIDHFLIKEFSSDNKKKYLILSLILNVGLLLYFKYANFFIDNVNVLLEQIGLDQCEWTKVVLPIGVSFFTFQKISYAMDIYSGASKQLQKFSDYLLYITLFPQLIAGPIVRFSTIESQITNRSENENFSFRLDGAFRFIIGLAKKILISNTLALQVDLIYELPYNELTSSLAWLGVICYTFHIYFDFSGYSDMAIGLGKMIGFRFPENFNFPYLSGSITEFWQRWHITLGTWMRDYLYIPLGGNRKSGSRTYVNLFIVFLISGFWHGASWNFVLWGAYHGVFLVMERLFLLKVYEKVPNLFRVILTFFVVLFGWVFFSCETLEQSMVMFERLFAFDIHLSEFDLKGKFYFYFVLALVFAFIGFDKSIRIRLSGFQDQITLQSNGVLIAAFVVMLFLFSLCMGEIMGNDFNPFIYYRF